MSIRSVGCCVVAAVKIPFWRMGEPDLSAAAALPNVRALRIAAGVRVPAGVEDVVADAVALVAANARGDVACCLRNFVLALRLEAQAARVQGRVLASQHRDGNESRDVASVVHTAGHDEFLSTAVAAKLLRCHPQTVRRWVDAGTLAGVTVAGRVRVARGDVERRARLRDLGGDS